VTKEDAESKNAQIETSFRKFENSSHLEITFILAMFHGFPTLASKKDGFSRLIPSLSLSFIRICMNKMLTISLNICLYIYFSVQENAQQKY